MKLLKSTATVGSATILSRILGFVRDMVLARMFGASGETDAFFLAFRIPNFMRRLFAEGSFSLAFVPESSPAVWRKIELGRHDICRDIEAFYSELLSKPMQ